MAVTTKNQNPGKLLGVWAHPDDEAYLAAGLMAETVALGGTVTLVAITDGELGFPETDTRSGTARAEQRRAEMTEAMAVIGVDDIRFLGVCPTVASKTSRHRSSPAGSRPSFAKWRPTPSPRSGPTA